MQSHEDNIVPAGMLPLPADFDRLLRVRVQDQEGEEHELMVRVPCFKPAKPRAPTSDDLRRLAPLELALKEAIALQRVRLDAEKLDEAFAPLFQVASPPSSFDPSLLEPPIPMSISHSQYVSQINKKTDMQITLK